MALPPVPSSAGLTPDQELAQWRGWKQQVEATPGYQSQLSGNMGAYFNGPNPRQNDPRFANYSPPGMFSAGATSMYNNPTSHYDYASGTVAKNKGFWDLPESYAILGAATGVAAPFIAPALAGLAGVGGAGGTGGGITGTALTNAGIQGGLGAVQGARTGGVRGALTGGALGFGTGLIPGAGPVNSVGSFAKNAAINAGVGGVKSLVSGGGVSGALKGAAGGAVSAIPLGSTLGPVASQAIKGAAQGGITGGTQGALTGGITGGISGGINQATAPLRTAAAPSPFTSTAFNTGTNLATGLAGGTVASLLPKKQQTATPPGNVYTNTLPPPGTNNFSTPGAPPLTPGGSPAAPARTASTTLTPPPTPPPTPPAAPPNSTFANSSPTFTTPPYAPPTSGTTSPATGDGSATPPADGSTDPSFWDKYGGVIGQAGGLAAGAFAGKAATAAAQTRSPEEQAALAGEQGSAGQLGKTGTSLIDESRPYVTQPAGYYQKLLTGDRAAMAEATAAPRAQIQSEYGGAKTNIDRSGVRGAAKDVLTGTLNRDAAGKVSALTTGVQPGAAAALANLGGSLLQTGTPMLAQSGNIYSNLLSQGNANRQDARQEGGKTAAAIGGLAADAGKIALGSKKKPTAPAPDPNAPPAPSWSQPGTPAPVGNPSIPSFSGWAAPGSYDSGDYSNPSDY